MTDLTQAIISLFIGVLVTVAIAPLIGRDRRKIRTERLHYLEQQAATDQTWLQYRAWCDSRVCLGGCGKMAKDRPRDANGVCTEAWPTEECCMECWKAGRSTGRSAESKEWTDRFAAM